MRITCRGRPQQEVSCYSLRRAVSGEPCGKHFSLQFSSRQAFSLRQASRSRNLGPGPRVKYLVPSTWTRYFVPCTWYQVPGTKYLVPGTWYQVPGTRYLVPGTWYHVHGTKYLVQVLGTRYLTLGPGPRFLDLEACRKENACREENCKEKCLPQGSPLTARRKL